MTELVNISPTLIIGLGGTGSLALQYVKRKIRNRLKAYKTDGRPLPRTIPFIEYLVLDTTPQEEVLDGLFVPDEYLNIGRVNVSRIINDLEHDLDYSIQKWFPRSLDPGQIDSGAGGVRAIGRLCFFINQARIESTIRQKVVSITNYEKIAKFLNENLKGMWIDEGSTIDVHIISSLCGGTGSACLLDTSYLVKHIINDGPKQMANSTAHLITSEPFEGEPGIGRTSREYIHSNFVVTLSEVEHFTKKDSLRIWDVEYRGGTKVSSKEKPFSVTYLLGCKEGVSLSKEHVCEIVGETIAINTVHPEGRRIKGMIENYKPHVINTEDLNERRRTYSSYNTRILSLDVDESTFESASRVTARTILTSLSDKTKMLPEVINAAFIHYEQMIFAAKMHCSHIGFEHFIKLLESKVPITPDMFSEVQRVSRSALSLPDKKRRQESQLRISTLILTSEAIENEILVQQDVFLNSLIKSFDELEKATDEHINSLLDGHSFPYVQVLLETIEKRIDDCEVSFTSYMQSFPSARHDYAGDMIAAIAAQAGQHIPTACVRKARAKIHGPVLIAFNERLQEFKRDVGKRIGWCRAAYHCITESRKQLPQERRIGPTSLTTSYVWTQAALEHLILERKVQFTRKFLESLEQKHARGSNLDSKICFLPQLNESLSAKEATEKLALEVAARALREEIDANAKLKRHEGLQTMHELVDIASPPWQIERLGEDVATVSITTCPENSEAGEIMSRSGKNISFGRNDKNENEFMIFRSEHGISVNHLINFRRCLKAVSRRIGVDGRINDICLDPTWNIASPLPIEEEVERLRLYFSLAIYFGLLKQEAGAYLFVTSSGRSMQLRKNHDVTRMVKRFEAFEKLLDLDCDGSADCRDFIRDIESEIDKRKEGPSIENFRSGLIAYQDSLSRLALEATDPRNQKQIEKESESIHSMVWRIDSFLKETRRNGHGS